MAGNVTCHGKSCKFTSFCDHDVDRSITGHFGPVLGELDARCPPGCTRRRQTDSEYAECKKLEWWGTGMVKCLEQGADCLHS